MRGVIRGVMRGMVRKYILQGNVVDEEESELLFRESV